MQQPRKEILFGSSIRVIPEGRRGRALMSALLVSPHEGHPKEQGLMLRYGKRPLASCWLTLSRVNSGLPHLELGGCLAPPQIPQRIGKWAPGGTTAPLCTRLCWNAAGPSSVCAGVQGEIHPKSPNSVKWTTTHSTDDCSAHSLQAFMLLVGCEGGRRSHRSCERLF